MVRGRYLLSSHLAHVSEKSLRRAVKTKRYVTGEGFEPSPPKRLVPETSALDRSAIQPIQRHTSAGFVILPPLNRRKRPKMRRPGIKPGSRPWQGRILSLYYRRRCIRTVI